MRAAVGVPEARIEMRRLRPLVDTGPGPRGRVGPIVLSLDLAGYDRPIEGFERLPRL